MVVMLRYTPKPYFNHEGPSITPRYLTPTCPYVVFKHEEFCHVQVERSLKPRFGEGCSKVVEVHLANIETLIAS